MAKGIDNRKTAIGAPVGYEKLREFFPTPSARARALGVKRDTIQVWDHRRAARLRRTSQGRVTLLLGLCTTVSKRMLNARDVGAWMLTPQPSLQGRLPVDLVLELGNEACGQIRLLVQQGDSALSSGEPLDGQDWDAIEAELDPVVAEQIRSAYERVVGGSVPGDLDVHELV